MAGSVGGNEVATKQVGFAFNTAGQMTNVTRFDQLVPDPTIATGALAASAYLYDAAGRPKFLNTPWRGDLMCANSRVSACISEKSAKGLTN